MEVIEPGARSLYDISFLIWHLGRILYQAKELQDWAGNRAYREFGHDFCIFDHIGYSSPLP